VKEDQVHNTKRTRNSQHVSPEPAVHLLGVQVCYGYEQTYLWRNYVCNAIVKEKWGRKRKTSTETNAHAHTRTHTQQAFVTMLLMHTVNLRGKLTCCASSEPVMQANLLCIQW